MKPKKILITGNMGYVGPAVVRQLRRAFPDAYLQGFDNAYFAHCLTSARELPERYLNDQIYGDTRHIEPALLKDVDAIVHLAAVSNDPMGKRFEEATVSINQEASVRLAHAAAASGVKSFVFASSCSVYGLADERPRREGDPLNPMTTYAASKIGTEQALFRLNSEMVITCLRFATACGMSERLRLDLVLNDFVAGALSRGSINVLSDGTPWRPLIDVADMARAIEWAVARPEGAGGRLLTVNVGSDDRNYQVRDLAYAVAEAVPGTSVHINTSAPVDSRSYRVDFSRFAALAPMHQPQMTLAASIQELITGLRNLGATNPDFRTSPFIRFETLSDHIGAQRLTDQLVWR